LVLYPQVSCESRPLIGLVDFLFSGLASLWVFLDEATAALDEDSQRRVMRLFDDELKQTTVLSIGHRPDLAVYHTRTLQLVHGLDGDRLKLKPPPAPPPPRRWLQRLDDWLLTIRS
jgi:vitamin B12/bleomycin/antimicrobial peptide transport system ATP-binding/permease protein